ncbi:hypothetical protein SELMODRAFT_423633 [Selaginella moellendorffii]|uniref:Uncharacterized protein n=1 Tax=Selaginella moellendorffii TaxID=88036 RepID=D8SMB8_SELML|nr:hypothetical protein SELMODRAFT_423633 [Selaginella moellendorffii]
MAKQFDMVILPFCNSFCYEDLGNTGLNLCRLAGCFVMILKRRGLLVWNSSRTQSAKLKRTYLLVSQMSVSCKKMVASDYSLDNYDIEPLHEPQLLPLNYFRNESADRVPLDSYCTDRHLLLIEEALVRAEVVADAGGLPEFSADGLLPLFRFELPHALNASVKAPTLLQTKWKRAEGDTIVIDLEGLLQPKQGWKIQRSKCALTVSCQDKYRKFSFPSDTLQDLKLSLDDESTGLLKITVPNKFHVTAGL